MVPDSHQGRCHVLHIVSRVTLQHGCSGSGIDCKRFCFIEFCADAVWIAFSRLLRTVDKENPDDLIILAALLQARVELAAAARYTDCLLIIFVFLAIVFFGVGVNIVRIGEQAPQDGLIKKCSFGFAGILAILASVGWGIKIRVYLEFYTDTDEFDLRSEDEWALKLLDVSRQLDFAFVVIAWALSIATLVRSTQIWLPSRRDKRLDYVSNLGPKPPLCPHKMYVFCFDAC